MSVTHRVLYVGIGGTGVHIGKELEIALDVICVDQMVRL